MLTDLAYEHTADLRREARATSGVTSRATAYVPRAASRADRAAPRGVRRLARAASRAFAAALRRPSCPVGCEA